VAFSPDGALVATISRDGAAAVWDASTGAPVTPRLVHNRTFRGHHQYQKIDFSPRGDSVVTAGEDGTARVWKLSHTTPLLESLNDLLILFGVQIDDDQTVYEHAALRETWRRLALAHRESFSMDDGEDGQRNHFVIDELARLVSEAAKTANWDTAVRLASRAVEMSPERPLSWRTRARLYLQRDDWKSALKDYSRAVELAPHEPMFLCKRGWILAEHGELRRALSDLSKAIDLNSEDPTAWNRRAIVHQRLGNLQQAIQDFTEAIDRDPKNFFFWTSRGHAFAAIGQWDQAIADYSQSMELDFRSGYARTWHLRGIANFKVGRLESAIDDLSRAIAMNAGEPSYWRDRGQVHAKAGQQERASADFDRYLSFYTRNVEVEPEDWSSWNRRGEAYFKLKLWPKSEADFSRAIGLDSENPLPWQNRASCHCEQGKWPEAAADLTRAIALGQNSYRPWHELALCHLAADNVAGYQEACRSMIAQFGETEDPLTAEFVAWSCALAPDALGQYGDAVLLGKKSVAESRPKPDARTYLGAVLYRASQVKQAIEHLTEANQLIGESPDNVRSSPAYTWYFLALAHHTQGNDEEAGRWLATATAWTEEVLAKHESGAAELAWNRRVTLQILRKEAEAMIADASEDNRVPTDAEQSPDPQQEAVENLKNES
jgi:tetratricopeptide (TPR) repeat protein